MKIKKCHQAGLLYIAIFLIFAIAELNDYLIFEKIKNGPVMLGASIVSMYFFIASNFEDAKESDSESNNEDNSFKSGNKNHNKE